MQLAQDRDIGGLLLHSNEPSGSIKYSSETEQLSASQKD
jgi:hypothetical protein